MLFLSRTFVQYVDLLACLQFPYRWFLGAVEDGYIGIFCCRDVSPMLFLCGSHALLAVCIISTVKVPTYMQMRLNKQFLTQPRSSRWLELRLSSTWQSRRFLKLAKFNVAL